MTDSVPHGSVYFTSSIDSGFVTVEEIVQTNSPVKIVPNKDEIIDDSVFNFRSISPFPKIFSLKKRRDKTNKHLKAFHSCVTAPTSGNLPNFDILDTPLSKYNIANKTRFKPNSTTSTTSTATATVGNSNKITGLKDLFSNTVCLIKEEGMPNTHSTLSSEDIKNACTVIDNTIREFKGERFKTDNISHKPHKDIEDECETHFRRKALIGMQKAKAPLCKETNLKQNDSGSVLMQESSLDDFNMLHDCEELEHETPFCDWFDLPEGIIIDTSESSDSEVHIEDKSLVSENETLSQQTTPLTSVLKEELKFKIQYKRLKYGQPELVLQPEKPKVYKLTDEEKEKRERRRQQNKKSAEKALKQRMEKETALRKEILSLSQSHQQLRRDIALLKKERNKLRNFIIDHKKSCKHIDSSRLLQFSTEDD